MGSDIAHTPTAAALLRNAVQKYGKKNQKMKEKSILTVSIFRRFVLKIRVGHYINPVHNLEVPQSCLLSNNQYQAYMTFSEEHLSLLE